jgi:hypothetical protein
MRNRRQGDEAIAGPRSVVLRVPAATTDFAPGGKSQDYHTKTYMIVGFALNHIAPDLAPNCAPILSSIILVWRSRAESHQQEARLPLSL